MPHGSFRGDLLVDGGDIHLRQLLVYIQPELLFLLLLMEPVQKIRSKLFPVFQIQSAHQPDHRVDGQQTGAVVKFQPAAFFQILQGPCRTLRQGFPENIQIHTALGQENGAGENLLRCLAHIRHPEQGQQMGVDPSLRLIVIGGNLIKILVQHAGSHGLQHLLRGHETFSHGPGHQIHGHGMAVYRMNQRVSFRNGDIHTIPVKKGAQLLLLHGVGLDGIHYGTPGGDDQVQGKLFQLLVGVVLQPVKAASVAVAVVDEQNVLLIQLAQMMQDTPVQLILLKLLIQQTGNARRQILDQCFSEGILERDHISIALGVVLAEPHRQLRFAHAAESGNKNGLGAVVNLFGNGSQFLLTAHKTLRSHGGNQRQIPGR